MTWSENPSYPEALFTSEREHNFFEEHSKTAQRALVVPGAVVGNHCVTEIATTSNIMHLFNT